MKVLTVLGARPQFIKASAVSRAFAACPEIEEYIVHTGQHYDTNLSDVFFRELGIPTPSCHLGIGSGPHGAQTGRMLAGLEPVMVDFRPDWVLVYGDTNSTLAGALAASKLHIPVAHVEAGLRSHNRRMPEEVNRIVTDHVSTLLFAPTDGAVAQLDQEGISGEQVRQVGDVMYDVALFFGNQAEARRPLLGELGLKENGYLLATIHRAENTEDPNRLEAIFDGLEAFSQKFPVLIPLHPRTLKKLGPRSFNPNLRIIDPVGYLDMMLLEKCAALIATDSGGVQKEAYFHQVPCVTFRDETEWPELVELGWNRLVSPISETQIDEALQAAFGTSGQSGNLYGSGNAASAIVEAIEEYKRPDSGD